MSKIPFFRDSNLESESDQRFESEPESESYPQRNRITWNYENLKQSLYVSKCLLEIRKSYFKTTSFRDWLKLGPFWKKNALKYVLFLGLLGEFQDSRIQASRFESRILESTIIRFESHESNGKLNCNLLYLVLDLNIGTIWEKRKESIPLPKMFR